MLRIVSMLLGTYFYTRRAGGSLASVVISFGFILLPVPVGGLLDTESDGYDICWTHVALYHHSWLMGLFRIVMTGREVRSWREAGGLSKDGRRRPCPASPTCWRSSPTALREGTSWVLSSLRSIRSFARPRYHTKLRISHEVMGWRDWDWVWCTWRYVIGSMYDASGRDQRGICRSRLHLKKYLFLSGVKLFW